MHDNAAAVNTGRHRTDKLYALAGAGDDARPHWLAFTVSLPEAK